MTFIAVARFRVSGLRCRSFAWFVDLALVKWLPHRIELLSTGVPGLGSAGDLDALVVEDRTNVVFDLVDSTDKFLAVFNHSSHKLQPRPDQAVDS